MMSCLAKTVMIQGKSLLTPRIFCEKDIRMMIHLSPVVNDIKKYQLLPFDLSKYTMKKLKLPKTGGRGLDGRVETNRIGGGAKRNYRMIDTVRTVPEGKEIWQERVLDIQRDPNRSGRIAIVAGEEKKRYILASEHMKIGNIVTTHNEIPMFPVQAKEGDSHPLGALPFGTLVHNVEIIPGEGGVLARAAGTKATVLRSLGDMVVLKMPSMREICVSKHCMATVGRVSNVDHNKEIIGSPQNSRWLGIRPRSGLWHRKTGYHGRKIRPIKPMIVVDVSSKKESAQIGKIDNS